MEDNWLIELLLWLALAAVAAITLGGASAVALVWLWQDRTR